MNQEEAIQKTKTWISKFVIGLKLCPFAKKPFEENKVRYVYLESNSEEKLLMKLAEELLFLKQNPKEETETSLIVHPHVLSEFDAYLDFIEVGNALINSMQMEGLIQIASFHPSYEFAGEPAQDPANYTNRSPYPMIHLLREASLTAAIDAHGNAESIPERNIDLLRDLGLEAIQRIIQDAS